MAPFRNPFEPVALPGEAIRLEPANEVREVKAIEQMGRIGPVDFGSATSGNQATESGSSIIELDDELEMNDNQLGQFMVNPLSLVDVEIRQTGDQDQRFVNKNSVGTITPYDPPNQRLIWTWEQKDPRVIITNPQEYDLSKTLLYFTGFKYVMESSSMSRSDVKQMAGEPASVPIDSLKKSEREATS